MKKPWYVGLYALSLVIGLVLLNKIYTKGYYIDHKHGFGFSGNEARLTAYIVIAFSVVGIVYTTLIKDRNIDKNKEPPNQAL